MGTSSANTLPNTPNFRRIAGSLRAPDRNAEVITDLTISAAVDFIPTAYITSPILSAIFESYSFLSACIDIGIEDAIQLKSFQVNERYFAFSLANELWKNSVKEISPQITNSPYGKIAEKAFKRTLSSIVSKGSAAKEDSEE